MKAKSWLSLAIREARGSAGRLVFFAACLSVGVAAVVAVAGLSQALDSGIQAQARQLLAADLAIESRREIDASVLDTVENIGGARSARVQEMPSVVSVSKDTGDETPGPSLLCEIKAVEPGYPFYGYLEIDPSIPLETILDAETVLVAPEVLVRLDLSPGHMLRIGDADFKIAGTISSEPDRLEVSFTLGPRVLMSVHGLDRSGLVGLGSRITHKLLVKLLDDTPAQEVTRTAVAIRESLSNPEFVNVETYVEAQPALRRGLQRVGQFLGLVALLSLLIGGIGVAQAVRAWLAGRLDAIAILRAMGVRPREVFALYLGQTMLLALVGSTAGALVGSLVAQALPGFVEQLVPVQIQVGWRPFAILRGIALGVGVAVIFGLRPLLDAVRVPPIRVLRRDADPLPVSKTAAVAVWAILVGGIALTATFQSQSVVRGSQFAGGLVIATILLSIGAWGVMKLVGSTPRAAGGIALKHGLAALARPGAGTLGAVVALGLGVVTVLGMHLVQQRLSSQLRADLPDEAPTAFLIDIQPDQWDGVRRTMESSGAEGIDSVEVVVARLRSINGVGVSELVQRQESNESDRSQRWVYTREQRLTSLETLPEDNVIVDGSLWSHPEESEVSIELDFAADLGVGVGDRIVFDVQGVPLELLVSSIRTVEWERFTINFFLVVEPGVLEKAPRFRIAAARIPQAEEITFQNRLATDYPNVTVLRIREVLEKVIAVLENLGFGVRVLGAFTVLAGITILAGSVSAGAVRRGREVALYKTLGMTRAQVASVFAVEYLLVGLVAGGIGTIGGIGLAWTVTRYGFEMMWAWSPFTYLVCIGLTIALSIIAGLAASTRALAVRPLSVLRQGE